MGWTNSVVTTEGIDMLNESLAGHFLTITHAVGGAGVLDPAELVSATDVVEEKQTFKLLGIEDVENGKKIKIQITNEDVTEKYILHQVAVFAQLNYQETPNLLFIMQDDRGVEIPPQSENPDFLFEMYAIIAISNKANIDMQVDRSGAVTVGFMNESIADALKKHNDNEGAHPHILKLLQETLANAIGSEGGIKKVIAFTIQPEDWVEAENENATYPLYFNLQDEEITADDSPMVVLFEDSLETAMLCGMCATAVSYDGYVQLKCVERPTSGISATCNLMGKGASGSGSGSGVVPYIIPAATATTLGGVKVKKNSGLLIDAEGNLSIDFASEEETYEAINKVFG